MNVTVLTQILAHVGMWLPITVVLCVIAVFAIRNRRPRL